MVIDTDEMITKRHSLTHGLAGGRLVVSIDWRGRSGDLLFANAAILEQFGNRISRQGHGDHGNGGNSGEGGGGRRGEGATRRGRDAEREKEEEGGGGAARRGGRGQADGGNTGEGGEGVARGGRGAERVERAARRNWAEEAARMGQRKLAEWGWRGVCGVGGAYRSILHMARVWSLSGLKQVIVVIGARLLYAGAVRQQ